MFGTIRRVFGVGAVAFAVSSLAAPGVSRADDAYCTDTGSCSFLEAWCESHSYAYTWSCFAYNIYGQCYYGACRYNCCSPVAPDADSTNKSPFPAPAAPNSERAK